MPKALLLKPFGASVADAVARIQPVCVDSERRDLESRGNAADL
jgi:hypothetical protein